MPHRGTPCKTYTSIMRWFLFLSTLALVDAGLVQTYCSNQNTGSSFNSVSSPYQSNGQCTTICANYAFAVVQGLNCWCSNYIPYNQMPVSNCASTCPGYPSELCGNTDRNLFGYVALGGKRASGTIGAPAATTQAAPPSTSTTITPQTIVNSIFVATTVTDTPTPSSTEEPTTSTTPPASTTAPPTIVVTTIVNSVGSVITVTSTPSLSANSELAQKSESSGVSPGVVAAIVVAIVAALAVIIGALLFMLWRRKKANKQLMQENESIQGVARMNSQMSKNGLLAGGAPLFAAGPSSAHPDSAGSGGLSRRDSRPMFYDQRLNPNVLMIHPDQSRNSVNTIDDHRDYGRKLNVTNPDMDRD